MRAQRMILFLLSTLLLGGFVAAVSFSAKSGKSEGRPKGMNYAAVVAEVNSEEFSLISASHLFDLDPRMLGVSIAAERAHNFLPIAENYIDAVFGTSVGFSQVNTVTFAETLAELFGSDTCYHFSSAAIDIGHLRSYFRRALGMKRYERKFLLLFDTDFNTAAAAMILRRSLERYNALAPQFNAFQRPDLAATLYHRTFPDTLRGIADEFGVMALRFYQDPSFMPHSLRGKEVSHARQ